MGVCDGEGRVGVMERGGVKEGGGRSGCDGEEGGGGSGCNVGEGGEGVGEGEE